MHTFAHFSLIWVGEGKAKGAAAQRFKNLA